MALWHLVLISFRPDVSKVTRDRIYDQYQTLSEACGGKGAGIQFFKVEHNLDLRKNVHLVELAVFDDNDALQRFRRHPVHAALTDQLSKVADWQVGDFIYPASVA